MENIGNIRLASVFVLASLVDQKRKQPNKVVAYLEKVTELEKFTF
jgi:hypothetical protein